MNFEQVKIVPRTEQCMVLYGRLRDTGYRYEWTTSTNSTKYTRSTRSPVQYNKTQTAQEYKTAQTAQHSASKQQRSAEHCTVCEVKCSVLKCLNCKKKT